MYRKTVVAGGITEVFEYEYLNINSGGYRPGDGSHREDNYKDRQKIRRNRVRQLICANFDSGSKFLTLTFKDSPGLDVKDVKQCNALFKDFAKRVRRRYPDFKYLAVIEFQDKKGRGAVHYHMICNLPYIPAKEIRDIWENGHVKVNRIKHVDNVGAYVVKYMVKNTDDKRLCGLNAYLRSKGLLEPLEACSWRPEDGELCNQLKEAWERETPSYVTEYESEHAGHISYRQYNMNREKVKT